MLDLDGRPPPVLRHRHVHQVQSCPVLLLERALALQASSSQSPSSLPPGSTLQPPPAVSRRGVRPGRSGYRRSGQGRQSRQASQPAGTRVYIAPSLVCSVGLRRPLHCGYSGNIGYAFAVGWGPCSCTCTAQCGTTAVTSDLS